MCLNTKEADSTVILRLQSNYPGWDSALVTCVTDNRKLHEVTHEKFQTARNKTKYFKGSIRHLLADFYALYKSKPLLLMCLWYMHFIFIHFLLWAVTTKEKNIKRNHVRCLYTPGHLCLSGLSCCHSKGWVNGVQTERVGFLSVSTPL